MKHDFLFSQQQQHPDFHAVVLFFSLSQHDHLFDIAGMDLENSNDIEKKTARLAVLKKKTSSVRGEGGKNLR